MRQTFAILAAFATFSTPAMADGPVLVELYTSQGCSSCPPADALLHRLAEQPDVIGLALHVDYWDYIGWKDNFADPAHTARQSAYADVAGSRTVYTPQMVIGGEDHVIGTRPVEVADVIERRAASPTGVTITLERSGDQLRITGNSPRLIHPRSVVQVIRYSPQETVDIRRGENAGRELSYANIVTDWRTVGEWGGQDALDLTVDVTGTQPVVVIVQEPGPGTVMATAILR